MGWKRLNRSSFFALASDGQTEVVAMFSFDLASVYVVMAVADEQRRVCWFELGDSSTWLRQ